MKIYDAVTDKENAKKLARAVGLNKIKARPTYSLYKTGAKVASAYGYPDEMHAATGKVYIVALDNFVWIAVIGLRDWFKTSPVLSCKPIKNGFKIETENSYYELREVK